MQSKFQREFITDSFSILYFVIPNFSVTVADWLLLTYCIGFSLTDKMAKSLNNKTARKRRLPNVAFLQFFMIGPQDFNLICRDEKPEDYLAIYQMGLRNRIKDSV